MKGNLAPFLLSKISSLMDIVKVEALKAISLAIDSFGFEHFFPNLSQFWDTFSRNVLAGCEDDENGIIGAAAGVIRSARMP